jgi:hypothetical protein
MLRRLRGRFGIAAPRVAVRTHISWHWRVLAAIGVISTSLALAGLIYDAGRRFAGFDRSETEQEIRALREKVETLQKEEGQLRGLANAGESSLQIERTAQQQLARQVKLLEEENGRLKEDLAFFENLASAEGKDAGFSLNRLRIDPDGAPGQYRYRALAAAQGGKKEREFKGNLQIMVSLQQDGKSAMIIFPAQNDPNRQRYNVSFRHFLRVDGTFQVPAGARLTSVELRLMQDGAMRATQTIKL